MLSGDVAAVCLAWIVLVRSRSFKRPFIVAASALVVIPFAAVDAATVQLAPGITYERIERPGPQVVHVVRARPGPLVRVAPILPGGSPVMRGSLTGAVRSRLASGAVAAINGDYFNVAQAYPSGVLVSDGMLVSEPEPSRSALVLGATTAAQVLRLELAGRYQSLRAGVFPPPAIRTFTGVNRPAERPNETLVYTPAYGPSTPTGDVPRAEAVVATDAGVPLVPNTLVGGTVQSVALGNGGTPIAPGQLLIVALGSAANTLLGDLAVGDRVAIEAALAGVPPGASALGGGPVLVQGGAPILESGEGFSAAQLGQRTARSAVGQAADGTILLVTSEGPQQGRVGYRVAEQAELLASLGAVTAIGMDAGGSAQLSVGDRLAIPWSFERSLTDALLISYAGLRIEPIVGRVSANADGVSDRATTRVFVPNPGTVRAVLAKRGGAPARVLVDGPAGPAPIALDADPQALGLPDGAYTLTADLTPSDGSMPSRDVQPIVLDRTLGGLRLRPHRVRGNVAVDARFTLARPARVTMRIVSANGRVVRIPFAGRPLKAGQRLLVWDGTLKRKSAAGAFSVSIEATTYLGATELRRDTRLTPPPMPAVTGAP